MTRDPRESHRRSHARIRARAPRPDLLYPPPRTYPRTLILVRDPWVGTPLLEHGPGLVGEYLTAEEVALSAATATALQRWDSDTSNPLWRAIADDSDPTRIGPLPADYSPDPEHAVEGFRLAARLQRELGDDWIIWYTSSHSFYGPATAHLERTVHRLLLRAFDGDPAASVVDLTGTHHEPRPAATFGATPATTSALALWRRAFNTSPDAETRAQGADAAALLQHDLGLTAQITYYAGDTAPGDNRPEP